MLQWQSLERKKERTHRVDCASLELRQCAFGKQNLFYDYCELFCLSSTSQAGRDISTSADLVHAKARRRSAAVIGCRRTCLLVQQGLTAEWRRLATRSQLARLRSKRIGYCSRKACMRHLLSSPYTSSAVSAASFAQPWNDLTIGTAEGAADNSGSGFNICLT